MFTLRLQKDAIGQDLTRLVDRIASPGGAQKRSISGAIRRSFQDNFTRQQSGNGAWARLAPSTVLDRQKKGFGGSGPILVRSGGLRASWVSEGSNHYSSVRSSGGITVYEEGSIHPLARFHEAGTSRMAARPVSLLSDSQESRIVDVIEFMILQIEQNTIGK
jgi:phage gpG-like protein